MSNEKVPGNLARLRVQAIVRKYPRRITEVLVGIVCRGHFPIKRIITSAVDLLSVRTMPVDVWEALTIVDIAFSGSRERLGVHNRPESKKEWRLSSDWRY